MAEWNFSCTPIYKVIATFFLLFYLNDFILVPKCGSWFICIRAHGYYWIGHCGNEARELADLNKWFFFRGKFRTTVLEVGSSPTYFKIISCLSLSFSMWVFWPAAPIAESSWVHPAIPSSYLPGLRLLLWEHHVVCTYSQGHREEGNHVPVNTKPCTLEGAQQTLLCGLPTCDTFMLRGATLNIRWQLLLGGTGLSLRSLLDFTSAQLKNKEPRLTGQMRILGWILCKLLESQMAKIWSLGDRICSTESQPVHLFHCSNFTENHAYFSWSLPVSTLPQPHLRNVDSSFPSFHRILFPLNLRDRKKKSHQDEGCTGTWILSRWITDEPCFTSCVLFQMISQLSWIIKHKRLTLYTLGTFRHNSLCLKSNLNGARKVCVQLTFAGQ